MRLYKDVFNLLQKTIYSTREWLFSRIKIQLISSLKVNLNEVLSSQPYSQLIKLNIMKLYIENTFLTTILPLFYFKGIDGFHFFQISHRCTCNSDVNIKTWKQKNTGWLSRKIISF